MYEDQEKCKSRKHVFLLFSSPTYFATSSRILKKFREDERKSRSRGRSSPNLKAKRAKFPLISSVKLREIQKDIQWTRKEGKKNVFSPFFPFPFVSRPWPYPPESRSWKVHLALTMREGASSSVRKLPLLPSLPQNSLSNFSVFRSNVSNHVPFFHNWFLPNIVELHASIHAPIFARFISILYFVADSIIFSHCPSEWNNY